GREAHVVYPPVRVPLDFRSARKDSYFFTASRLVPYKNTRAIVEAFALIPGERLIVAGDGPERDQLRRIAPRNVEFLGFVKDEELAHLMESSSAFIFAAEEDFGIAPLEAQSLGTPVIALNRGGARETILGSGSHPTGIFFPKPEASCIAAAVGQFLATRDRF